VTSSSPKTIFADLVSQYLLQSSERPATLELIPLGLVTQEPSVAHDLDLADTDRPLNVGD
jgi:hypothetical protein